MTTHSHESMRNVHRLRPCRLCRPRMAVPGSVLCTVCDSTLADLVPANIAGLVA
jgi:hypothetical protein